LITNVLIAVDGSECANRALEFGLDLADKHSASVTILNVIDLPTYTNPEDPLSMPASMTGFIKDLRAAHQKILDKAAEKAANLKPTLKIAAELLEGNPPTQIVTTAAEGNFNLIVLGHGSEGRIREMFLGGTSERVAHLAKCAVLIVK
jgi:nucleotide-binding universal stress UspA family protein